MKALRSKHFVCPFRISTRLVSRKNKVIQTRPFLLKYLPIYDYCVNNHEHFNVFFLSPSDPFAVDKSEQEGLIHIRIQQRNGRKTLTTVQGISDKNDKKRLVKYFKKVGIFFCVAVKDEYKWSRIESCLVSKVFCFS